MCCQILKSIDYRKLSLDAQRLARDLLAESRIVEIWENSGCKVNIVGSLRMGLLAAHRDIDLHVYSSGITTESSFAVMAKIAKDKRVKEIKCINGLYTDERCIAWHILYSGEEGMPWQIDIIHIEAGSEYDGYFERMADRIIDVATDEQIDTILRLKFETPPEKDFHGVEYYEAVIADGISDIESFTEWVKIHRAQKPYYWIP